MVVLTGHPALAPAAAFGGMTAVHARFEPYALRGRLLVGVGAGLVLCVALGGFAAAIGIGAIGSVVLVAVVAAAAKLGTLVGVVGGGLLLAADLPVPARFACIVVALLLAELTVIRNYALAMLFITPLTLLLGSLGTQVNALGMASDRLLDTALGAVIGLGAAIVRPGRGYHLAPA